MGSHISRKYFPSKHYHHLTTHTYVYTNKLTILWMKIVMRMTKSEKYFQIHFDYWHQYSLFSFDFSVFSLFKWVFAPSSKHSVSSTIFLFFLRSTDRYLCRSLLYCVCVFLVWSSVFGANSQSCHFDNNKRLHNWLLSLPMLLSLSLFRSFAPFCTMPHNRNEIRIWSVSDRKYVIV